MHDCLAIPLPRGRTGRAGASIQQGIRRQLEEENRKLKQLVGDSPKAQLPGRGPPRSQVSVVAGPATTFTEQLFGGHEGLRSILSPNEQTGTPRYNCNASQAFRRTANAYCAIVS